VTRGATSLAAAADPALHAQLERLARAARVVFVAGLPGTGKSLVIQQLARLAAVAGRHVHLLQWDVARPVFEATEAGRRYPVVDGVTHPMVRAAVGLWARHAVAEWARRERDDRGLLLGEAPLVGHRLIELARPAADAAEPILSAPSCRFAIAVPSVEVRAFVEAERERRAARPLHPREREDAPPVVLRALWRELNRVARRLAVAAPGDDAPYDPEVYRRVYEAVLRRRHAETIALRTVLPTAESSVYELGVAVRDLVPRAETARAAMREAEARYPDAAALAHEVERWWAV
jgi:hypothetical protein